MNSDHGYPDPKTDLNEGFMGFDCKDRVPLGHDLVLTDDNIKTPLLLKYPGCQKNIQIPPIVGHIDIIPTIFDILNIPQKKIEISFKGKSLLPIIEGEEKDNSRIIRSDTRLTMDAKRITSYRSCRYKYIYYYDESCEMLYDMLKDPEELDNILENEADAYTSELQQFRELAKGYEKEVFHYHQAQLDDNARKSFAKLKKKYSSHNVKILVITKAPEELLRILAKNIRYLFNGCELDLLYSENQRFSEIDFDKKYIVSSFKVNEISKLNLGKYLIVIYLTENSNRVFLKDELIKAVKSIPTTHYRLMNYNFKLFNYFSAKWMLTHARLFFDWDRKGFFYKKEPFYFINDILFFAKQAFSVILSKKSEDVMAAKEILEFRNAHLKKAKKLGYRVEPEEMAYEVDRIKTRED